MTEQHTEHETAQTPAAGPAPTDHFAQVLATLIKDHGRAAVIQSTEADPTRLLAKIDGDPRLWVVNVSGPYDVAAFHELGVIAVALGFKKTLPRVARSLGIGPSRDTFVAECTEWTTFTNLQVGDVVDYWGYPARRVIKRTETEHGRIGITVQGPYGQDMAAVPGDEQVYRAPRAITPMTEETAAATMREIWPEAEAFERAPGGWTCRIGAGYAWITDSNQAGAEPEGDRTHARRRLAAVRPTA